MGPQKLGRELGIGLKEAKEFIAVYFEKLSRVPNFGWVWFFRFLAGIAMTAFLSFFVLYLITNLHFTPAEAGARAGLLSLYSAPVSIALFTGSGWLSDKLGRRKPFVIGSALVMALALIIGGQAASFNQFIVTWMVCLYRKKQKCFYEKFCRIKRSFHGL